MASERHEEEQAEKAFTISDKRLFTREGARRDPDTPRETPAARAHRRPHPRGVKRHAPRSRSGSDQSRSGSGQSRGLAHAVTCRQPILPCW